MTSHLVSVFSPPTLDDIRAAAERIRPRAQRTPLRRCDALSRIAGVEVSLKLENEQTGGSFKIRGAFNAIAELPPDVRSRGIVAASAGNHGLGISLAAQHFGVAATVFVPASAASVKKDGMRRNAAVVFDDASHYDHAAALAKAYAASSGATYVDACAGRTLLAGQGTVALEILEDLPQVETVVVPVGGGGLLGGVGAYARAAKGSVRIVGAQGVDTNALALSLAAGRVTEIPDRPTIAEGLAGQVDDYALEIGRRYLDDIVTLGEDEIAHAIAWLWNHERVRAEGAGAVSAAAVLEQMVELAGPTVLIISGGNIDADKHARIVAGRSR